MKMTLTQDELGEEGPFRDVQLNGLVRDELSLVLFGGHDSGDDVDVVFLACNGRLKEECVAVGGLKLCHDEARGHFFPEDALCVEAGPWVLRGDDCVVDALPVMHDAVRV